MPNRDPRPVGASFDPAPTPVNDLGRELRPAVAQLVQSAGTMTAAGRQTVAAMGEMVNAQLQANEATAQLKAKIADGLNKIGSRIGDFADRAAIKEGAAAGEQAGLDPEFRTRNDYTLYGEAFDKAGLETYKSRLSVMIEQHVGAIEDKHGSDPAGLNTAFSAVSKGFLEKIPQELRVDVATTLERRRISAMRQATRNVVAEQKAEQTAALNNEVESRLKSLQQTAYRTGLDPTADAMLSEELTGLMGRLQVTGADGKRIVSPKSAEKLMKDLGGKVAEARLKGAFVRLPDMASRERFVADLQQKYMEGGDPLLNEFLPDDFERLAGGMVSDIRSEKVAGNAAAAGVRQEVKVIADMAEKGYGLSEEDMATLQARVTASGDPALAAGFDEARNTLAFVQTARKMPPVQLEQEIVTARASLTDGATPQEIARVELAEKVLGTARESIARDPIDWATKTGLIAVPELDLSSPQAAAKSLQARAAVAGEVASYYGRDTVYFREGERAALANVARQGGIGLVDMATTMVSALGPEAPKALAEISKDAPEAAVVGGLMTTNGDPMFVKDVATGLQLRATDPAFKALAPSEGQWRPIVAQAFGNALAVSPETQSALVASANAAYEVRARRLGLDDFDPDVYEGALKAAAGEVYINDRAYGGVTEYNGRRVLVPAEVRQDRFDDLIEEIDYKDFPQTGVMPHAGGKGANLATFRRAQLVSIGDGRYWAALGDPDSEDPQYLQDAKGEAYVLDLRKMMPTLRQRRPDYFRGG